MDSTEEQHKQRRSLPQLRSQVNEENYQKLFRQTTHYQTKDIYFALCQNQQRNDEKLIIFSMRKLNPLGYVDRNIGFILFGTTPSPNRGQNFQRVIQDIGGQLHVLDIRFYTKINLSQTKFHSDKNCFKITNPEQDKIIKFQNPTVFNDWMTRIRDNQSISFLSNYPDKQEIMLEIDKDCGENKPEDIYLIKRTLRDIQNLQQISLQEYHEFYSSYLSLMSYCIEHSVFFSQKISIDVQKPHELFKKIKQEIQQAKKSQPNNLCQYYYQSSFVQLPNNQNGDLRGLLKSRNNKLSEIMKKNLAINVLIKTLYKFKDIEDRPSNKQNSLSKHLQDKITNFLNKSFDSTNIDAFSCTKELQKILQQFVNKAKERSMRIAQSS